MICQHVAVGTRSVATNQVDVVKSVTLLRAHEAARSVVSTALSSATDILHGRGSDGVRVRCLHPYI
ncbi:hypothetical protein E2C01_027641 [Portunus trituberculatus]|uniref:Uncharacterized protein n=1 Tax=Portunus trituberculatus TaxID=210409 RepID=A0A5B7EM29_PORTR|nr:hypothetical protein [Portunus trituberculatus]